MSSKKRLFLLDGSAIFYRSYFAFIRRPLINSKGEDTSAIFGFASSLIKILKEEKPDYIAVVFDTKEPTFRHKMYKPYKATREKMPEEMAAQYPQIIDLVKTFGIPTIEKSGFEADDVIATLAQQAEKQGLETYMVTGDKDFMQLLSPMTKMYVIRPGKDAEILDLETLKKKFGMTPEQVVDYLALMGDSSDNVPGVPGVGEKTAKTLLEQFGSLDNAYANIRKIEKPSVLKKLVLGKEKAYLSKELVTINRAVPLNIDIDEMVNKPPDLKELRQLFEAYEFRILLNRLSELGETEAQESFSIDSVEKNYRLIQKKSDFDELVRQLKTSPFFVFDTETTGLDTFDSDILGIALSLQPFDACYLALNDPESELSAEEILNSLRPIFEDPAVQKGGQNIKYDGLMLYRHGILLKGISFDTMIADYLIRPGTRRHKLDILAKNLLNYKMIPIEDLIGKRGKKQKNMSEIHVSEVYPYACEDADVTMRLKELLEKELIESGTKELFDSVEMPLVKVLMEMEKNGVKLDVPFLNKMSGELAVELTQLEESILTRAGKKFNVNSSQQLGKVLFEDLEIHKELGNRRPTRTATGQYSTSEQVLEKFSDHPIVKDILEYRKLNKLKSTYVDALPALVSKRTGRLHTSFNQTVAATGRLSSSDPNLQNIPIRTEIGRKIRRAFIAEKPEDMILSADYSQIELRMMAHLSGDSAMKEAFFRGEDIHATTAAAIFNIPIEMVNPDQRRKAKEVNFGIIYGISSYGLASRLHIPVEEARNIIENYFVRFPRVNDYMIHTISYAQQNKYVKTILNRRRYVREIDSRNANIRQNAERIAINTTIQGSAADLIKLAMIHIQDRLEKENLRTKMMLQVHDELVFEVKGEELEQIKTLVKTEMENALKLNVPVKVDVGIGKNWLEAH